MTFGTNRVMMFTSQIEDTQLMYTKKNQGYGTLTFAIVSVMLLTIVTTFVHVNNVPTNDFGRLDVMGQSR